MYIKGYYIPLLYICLRQGRLLNLPKKGFCTANFANFSLLLFDFTAKLNINGFWCRIAGMGKRKESREEKKFNKICLVQINS